VCDCACGQRQCALEECLQGAYELASIGVRFAGGCLIERCVQSVKQHRCIEAWVLYGPGSRGVPGRQEQGELINRRIPTGRAAVLRPELMKHQFMQCVVVQISADTGGYPRA
jgi:hypothetical protein